MSCRRRLPASDEVENSRTDGREMVVTDVGEKWVSPRFFAFLGEWGWGGRGERRSTVWISPRDSRGVAGQPQFFNFQFIDREDHTVG